MLTYHMVHLYAGPVPVIQNTYGTLHEALAAIRFDREGFDAQPGHGKYPSAIRWSRDGGETLNRLPDAYHHGYQDGDSDAQYELAVSRGIVQESKV